MDKFLDILKQRMDYYYEDIHSAKIHADNILDFCNYPFDNKEYSKLKKVEKQELERIISKIKYIRKKLSLINTDFVIENSEDF